MAMTHRLATRDDLPLLTPLVDASIDELQKDYLSEEQIRSGRAIMGLDTQLIDDGTYFVIEIDGEVAGCGGWSRRPPCTAGTTPAAGTRRCSIRPRIRRGCGRCTRTPSSSVAVWAG